MARTCEGTTTAGGPCTAPAQRRSRFCFHHDPDQVQARKDASILGGKARSAQLDRRPERREVEKLPALKDARAAKELIEATVRWLLLGELDPRAATAIGGLVRAFAELHKDEEVERQVREIENALRQAPQLTNGAHGGVA